MTAGRVPAWARKYFNDRDLELIEKAVGQAERNTAGEIVPMVVQSSVTLWPARVITVLFFAIIALMLNDLFSVTGFGAVLLNAFAWVLGIILGYIPAVQSRLGPREWRDLEVAKRAELEFYRARLHQTERQTGIMIFISLLERRVIVFGDQAIAKKIAPDTWTELVRLVSGGLREDRAGAGLVAAIERCGQILAQHFPLSAHDTNELANNLIFRE